MKMFIIFWLCVQDPLVSLENTCVQNIIYDTTYDTKEECRQASVVLAKQFMDIPHTYITTFCTSKFTTNT